MNAPISPPTTPCTLLCGVDSSGPDVERTRWSSVAPIAPLANVRKFGSSSIGSSTPGPTTDVEIALLDVATRFASRSEPAFGGQNALGTCWFCDQSQYGSAKSAMPLSLRQ